MFLTPAEVSAELDALEGEMHPNQQRQAAIEAWVRSLPTPPTHTMHPSEYPCRAPQYLSFDLLHIQEHTIEDLRHKDAKGNPLRIFPR